MRSVTDWQIARDADLYARLRAGGMTHGNAAYRVRAVRRIMAHKPKNIAQDSKKMLTGAAQRANV